MLRRFSSAGLALCVAILLVSPTAGQSRVLGLDVSAWQGNISSFTWNGIHNAENHDFVFIRSSRGGTTGFYNQSNPGNDNPPGQNTFSQRYDDHYFVQNITRATNAGLYAGPYHFSRPDLVETTLNSGGIANTGADEADHFIQMAGAWMRPGYLLPVHDLEAGDQIRSDNELAQFALDFSDRVHEVMGIRPAIYVNGNYAHFVIGEASPSLRTQVVSEYPVLWMARWPDGFSPFTGNPQTENPSDSISWTYGAWDDPPNPAEPWSFWQYTPVGRLQSYLNGNANLDLNVANGGIEFLKDNLVPALWMNDSDGEWTTLDNWNSGQTPIAPVQGPGQFARVGPLTLPTERLPSIDDTVILDRSGANITVTLSSGTHEIRKLDVRESLAITGGSLTVNYVPSADSTPLSAEFSAPVSLDGGSLSVHTLQVNVGQTFSLGGSLTLNTIQLLPHALTPARIDLIGDADFNPLDDAAAFIENASGAGNSAIIDLGGENRSWNVADGSAEVDLSVDVPIINGALTKSGPGTLALLTAGTYAGDTAVEEGSLRIDDAFLADGSDVYLSTGATLNLNFAGSPDVVDSFFIDGVSQAAGIWGAPGSGAQFTSPLLAGTGLLEVSALVPVLPGDFNNDGLVDVADYSTWLAALGASDETLINNNGDGGGVSFSDYDLWRSSLGNTSSSSSGNSSVPEPTSMALFLVAAVGLIRRCPPRARQSA